MTKTNDSDNVNHNDKCHHDDNTLKHDGHFFIFLFVVVAVSRNDRDQSKLDLYVTGNFFDFRMEFEAWRRSDKRDSMHDCGSMVALLVYNLVL